MISLERSHDELLMGKCRRANDGCVHLAVLVNRGHVIRMDEYGIIAEIPLRPTALPDAEGTRTFNKKDIFAKVSRYLQEFWLE